MSARALPIGLLVALALAAPAGAKVGAEISFTPELAALPSGMQTVTVTVKKVRHGEAGFGRPERGVQVSLFLDEVGTQRRRNAFGGPTDSRGRAKLRIAIPTSGTWRPTVSAGHGTFTLGEVGFGPTESAAAQGTASSSDHSGGSGGGGSGGGGFPWLPVGGGAAVLLLLVAAASRRRRWHPRPRLGD